jgi:protein transport protein SEC24
MPVLLPLTSERLARFGLFFLEDGHSMYLWIGRDAVPQLLMDVFDKPSYDQLPPSGKVRHSLGLILTAKLI